MTTMPAVALLAGGLAKRLGPLTKQMPKSMLEVAGEPFIAHQLRLLSRERIARVATKSTARTRSEPAARCATPCTSSGTNFL